MVFRSLYSKGEQRFSLRWQDRYPCLKDKTNTTGFDRYYVYHTAWAARKLVEIHPKEHVDIGSSHYFSTLVSAFIPISFYDFRPAIIRLSNLEIGHADLTQLQFHDNSILSLSCMHVVEHIGLGRYGDPIDPDGDLKAMDELMRVLAPGGHLYFVVPVGQPSIRFNAHRIYDPVWVRDHFTSCGLILTEFAVITDKGVFMQSQQPENFKDQIYACGCYAFQKVNQISS